MRRSGWKRAYQSSRPRLTLTSGVSEHTIQSQVFEWAGLMTRVYPQLCTMFAVPNGGYLLAGDKRQRAMASNKLKAEGMKPGVPDVCLPVANAQHNALFIEHKSEDGPVRDNQLWWHARLREVGCKVIVSRSFEESRRAIVEYLSTASPMNKEAAP